MPIRPENRGYYQTPAWREANARIRARAGSFCEWCKKPEGYVWQTLSPRYLYTPEHIGSVLIYDEQGHVADLTRKERDEFEAEARWVKCVLTVAHHPDPNPENLAMDNLHLLCQRCHNRADAPMRAKNAAETRRRKRAAVQPSLPLTTPA